MSISLFDFMRKAKTALDRCRPRSQAVTLHDLHETEKRIIKAIEEKADRDLEAAIHRLKASSERVNEALKTAPTSEEKDKT